MVLEITQCGRAVFKGSTDTSRQFHRMNVKMEEMHHSISVNGRSC